MKNGFGFGKIENIGLRSSMIKRLFTWDFFMGILFGILIGAVLATFLYMKNVDIFKVRERQEYLIKEVEELRKEREAIIHTFKEKDLIEDWNRQAVVVEPEIIKGGKNE